MPFHEGGVVHFPEHECLACPLRAQCTKSKHGRTISIDPDESLLVELRERQTSEAGRAQLRQRVSVEHTLAHIVHWQGHQARYLGLRKNLFDLPPQNGCCSQSSCSGSYVPHYTRKFVAHSCFIVFLICQYSLLDRRSRCNSTGLVKTGRSHGVQKYLCSDCDRTFKERPRFVCECLIPGHQPKCQSCPQFQEFLGLVKQKMDELSFLSFQELQNLKSSYTVAETLD